ncbi:hypothetical protein SAMN02745196_00820 [Clostridium collagenovorans DSM 3089]|uniref:Uncharacterized protein n=1 Tax=Clostridium collagenovorans DSM 3089 TaxID=1121306 RepID=A0A1M5U2Q7_9CLOT|nr:hypothetical protein [Clostridium collagenovorans]SHH57228.1 hypothetical protein SAMN02745196_00820 [Clostridium collagenovorans DSM 3089]
MKKRQIIAGAMGILMMSVVILPVHAETMDVTYREPNNYTVTIPSSVDLSNGATSKQIEVKDVNLEPSREIKVKITQGVDSNGVVELSREDDTETKAVTTISITQSGTGIAKDTDFVSFTANGTQDLYFSDLEAKNGGTIKAGNYNGQLVFTVTAPEKK